MSTMASSASEKPASRRAGLVEQLVVERGIRRSLAQLAQRGRGRGQAAGVGIDVLQIIAKAGQRAAGRAVLALEGATGDDHDEGGAAARRQVQAGGAGGVGGSDLVKNQPFPGVGLPPAGYLAIAAQGATGRAAPDNGGGGSGAAAELVGKAGALLQQGIGSSKGLGDGRGGRIAPGGGGAGGILGEAGRDAGAAGKGVQGVAGQGVEGVAAVLPIAAPQAAPAGTGLPLGFGSQQVAQDAERARGRQRGSGGRGDSIE